MGWTGAYLPHAPEIGGVCWESVDCCVLYVTSLTEGCIKKRSEHLEDHPRTDASV